MSEEESKKELFKQLQEIVKQMNIIELGQSRAYIDWLIADRS